MRIDKAIRIRQAIKEGDAKRLIKISAYIRDRLEKAKREIKELAELKGLVNQVLDKVTLKDILGEEIKEGREEKKEDKENE